MPAASDTAPDDPYQLSAPLAAVSETVLPVAITWPAWFRIWMTVVGTA